MEIERALVLGHGDFRKSLRYFARHHPGMSLVCRRSLCKTVGPHARIRDVLNPLEDHIAFAAIYGSVAKHTDTATSDVDLLVVSDELTLEALYAALAPAEETLARKINPTLYTSREFERRRKAGNAFLKRVLAGEHVVLVGNDRAA